MNTIGEDKVQDALRALGHSRDQARQAEIKIRNLELDLHEWCERHKILLNQVIVCENNLQTVMREFLGKNQ